jgi:hypothetical protein
MCFFTGPADPANFNQVLSKHLYDIELNLTFFGPNWIELNWIELDFFWSEYELWTKKSNKIASAFEKNRILSQKPWKNPFFFDFLDFQAPGADISAPNFKNS